MFDDDLGQLAGRPAHSTGGLQSQVGGEIPVLFPLGPLHPASCAATTASLTSAAISFRIYGSSISSQFFPTLISTRRGARNS